MIILSGILYNIMMIMNIFAVCNILCNSSDWLILLLAVCADLAVHSLSVKKQSFHSNCSGKHRPGQRPRRKTPLVLIRFAAFRMLPDVKSLRRYLGGNVRAFSIQKTVSICHLD